MLSFLREQSNVDLPAQKPDAAAETASSDGTEKSQEREYLTVAASEKRTRKSTILLAVLFIIGLLCLGYMIKKSTPQVVSAAPNVPEESELEAAVARLIGIKSEMFNGMGEIVDKFNEFSDVLQIKVGELVKNPFKLEVLSANVKEESRVEIKVPEIDAEMAQRQQVIQKAKEMKLLSIMQSDQSDQSDRRKCCMIGDKILYEGGYIREFKVCQIGDNFVRLEWNPGRSSGSEETQSEPVVIVLSLSD
jgi:preprotein translocase subunit SecG